MICLLLLREKNENPYHEKNNLTVCLLFFFIFGNFCNWKLQAG